MIQSGDTFRAMTDHLSPTPAFTLVPANTSKRRRRGRAGLIWRLVFAVPVAMALTACGGATTGGEGAVTGETASVVDTEAAAAADQAAAAQAAAAEQAASGTVSQQNAYAKATSYLKTSAFSRSGLADQLVYEGFSAEDAEFAIARLEAAGGVDWNTQAAAKAASYLKMSSFSRASLLEQLTYEGFTAEQAEYGVSSTGL